MFQYSQSLSERIANKYGHLFEKRQCYENVFKLATSNITELNPSSKLSILFCYMPGAADFHYRHAFCLYDGMIVEPLLHLNMQDKDLNSIVPIRLINMQEYYSLLVADGRYDLWNVLLKDNIQAFNNSKINLNPVDLTDLVSCVTKSSDEFLHVMQSAMTGKGIHTLIEQPESESKVIKEFDTDEPENENVEILGGLINMSLYTEKGFENRNEYLKDLAKQYNLDMGNVRIWAHVLGPDADFTDLPKLCEQKRTELVNVSDPYRARGYNNSADYFSALALEYALPDEMIEKMASEMKPTDHFDRLPAQLQEAHDNLYGKMYDETEDDLENEEDGLEP